MHWNVAAFLRILELLRIDRGAHSVSVGLVSLLLVGACDRGSSNSASSAEATERAPAEGQVSEDLLEAVRRWQAASSSIELYRVQNWDRLPLGENGLIDWDILIQDKFLMYPPVNPLRGSSEVGTEAEPGVGWLWDQVSNELHLIDRNGVIIPPEEFPSPDAVAGEPVRTECKRVLSKILTQIAWGHTEAAAWRDSRWLAVGTFGQTFHVLSAPPGADAESMSVVVVGKGAKLTLHCPDGSEGIKIDEDGRFPEWSEPARLELTCANGEVQVISIAPRTGEIVVTEVQPGNEQIALADLTPELLAQMFALKHSEDPERRALFTEVYDLLDSDAAGIFDLIDRNNNPRRDLGEPGILTQWDDIRISVDGSFLEFGSAFQSLPPSARSLIDPFLSARVQKLFRRSNASLDLSGPMLVDPEVLAPSLRTLAERGSVRAQVQLGEWYKGGWGIPRSDTEAEKWYRLAAEQGHPVPQRELGKCMVWSVGASRADAMPWLRAAADQGDAEAMYELGRIVDTGAWGFNLLYGADLVEDLVHDEAEATRWYTESAKAGWVPAQVELGERCFVGFHTPKDDASAYAWLTIATADSSEWSMHPMEKYHALLLLEQLSNSIQPADLARGQLLLAGMYQTGVGGHQDPEKALKWASSAKGVEEEQSVTLTYTQAKPTRAPAVVEAQETNARGSAGTEFQSQWEQAEELLLNGNLAEAEAHLTRAASIEDVDRGARAMAFVFLSAVRSHRQDLDGAQAFLDRAIQLDGDALPVLLMEHGLYTRRNGCDESSRAISQKLIRKLSEDGDREVAAAICRARVRDMINWAGIDSMMASYAQQLFNAGARLNKEFVDQRQADWYLEVWHNTHGLMSRSRERAQAGDFLEAERFLREAYFGLKEDVALGTPPGYQQIAPLLLGAAAACSMLNGNTGAAVSALNSAIDEGTDQVAARELARLQEMLVYAQGLNSIEGSPEVARDPSSVPTYQYGPVQAYYDNFMSQMMWGN